MGDAFGTLLLRYLTDVLGMAAAVAALIFSGSKLYDAVVDPLIGNFSDRLRTRIGRRRPFLILGIVTSPLTLLAMFMFPPLKGTLLVAYGVFVLLLYSTSYALWEVPYVAMPPEIAQSYHERTRLFAYRNYAANIGQIFFVAAGPWLLAYVGASRRGYGYVGVSLATLAMVANLICVRATASAPFSRAVERRPFRFKDVYLKSLRSWPFCLLIMAKGAMFVGFAAQSGVFAYFVQYVLGANDVWLGNLLLVMTFASIASVPVWLKLDRYLEKKFGAIIGVLLIIASSLSWITATNHESTALLILRVSVKSAGMTGFIIFIYSMFTDVVEYQALSTGERQEGSMSGMFATAEKLFSALGLACVGLVLQLGGYVSHKAAGAHQTAVAVNTIRMTYATAPACAGVLCVLLLLLYPLKAQTFAAKRKAIEV